MVKGNRRLSISHSLGMIGNCNRQEEISHAYPQPFAPPRYLPYLARALKMFNEIDQGDLGSLQLP